MQRKAGRRRIQFWLFLTMRTIGRPSFGRTAKSWPWGRATFGPWRYQSCGTLPAMFRTLCDLSSNCKTSVSILMKFGIGKTWRRFLVSLLKFTICGQRGGHISQNTQVTSSHLLMEIKKKQSATQRQCPRIPYVETENSATFKGCPLTFLRVFVISLQQLTVSKYSSRHWWWQTMS